MGCDGGTIPKRCELVREKKKPEKVDKEYELNAKWFHCAISQQELAEPIVCCELGNLYRKESVLEYLLDKSKATTDIAKHVRSLKDVKELVLTRKNGKSAKDLRGNGHAADAYLDFQASNFICPISGLEMNGRYRFCFSWRCGCVFSERGLKEVPSPTCHNCGTPFNNEDLIVINGSEDDVSTLKERMLALRQKAKEEKKSKKLKRHTLENSEDALKSSKIPKTNVSANNHESTSQASASIVGKESKLKHAKSKNGASSSAVSKGETSSSSQTDLAYSRYKSVAENPEASKVFKSLFSSSHKDKPGRLQPHWVTYQSYHC